MQWSRALSVTLLAALQRPPTPEANAASVPDMPSRSCPFIGDDGDPAHRPEWEGMTDNDDISKLRLLPLGDGEGIAPPQQTRPFNLMHGHGAMEILPQFHDGHIASDPLFAVLLDYREQPLGDERFIKSTLGRQSFRHDIVSRSPVTVANVIADVLAQGRLNLDPTSARNSTMTEEKKLRLLRDVLKRATTTDLPGQLTRLGMPREARLVEELLDSAPAPVDALVLDDLERMGRAWLDQHEKNTAELADSDRRYGVVFHLIRDQEDTCIWFLSWQRDIEELSPEQRDAVVERGLMRPPEQGLHVTGLLEQQLLSSQYYGERAVLFEWYGNARRPRYVSMAMTMDIPSVHGRVYPRAQQDQILDIARHIDELSHKQKLAGQK